MNPGRVTLIGAGPGDPGLLTLRGREALARAEVVVYDRLVAPALLAHAPNAERLYVGKAPGAHAVSQEEINRLLIAQARMGREVARLKGGDPFLFGRGGEEALALAAEGIPFEVVPGVTAALGAAACAGMPLTHRGLASGVIFITGHEDPDKATSGVDWDLLARWPGTLACYMGMERLEDICAALVARGMPADRPTAIVQSATTPCQRVVTAPLGALPRAAQEAGLHPPAMLLVGPVTALHESLAWFERRPLFGRKIIVTRPAARAEELSGPLAELGAEVIEAPAIAIAPPLDLAPLRAAVSVARKFDWIVFTSAEGVAAFFRMVDACGLDARILGNARIAAIGPATARRLRAEGLRADLVPAKHTTEALAEAFRATGALDGKSVLCPRADIAPPALTAAFSAQGALVETVTAYRVLSAPFDADAIRGELLARRVHWITFTSPSTVEHFCEAVGIEAVASSGAQIASIGPVTSAALRGRALAPVEAAVQSAEGIFEAIVRGEGVK